MCVPWVYCRSWSFASFRDVPGAISVVIQSIFFQITPSYERYAVSPLSSPNENSEKPSGGNHSDETLFIKKIDIRFLQNSISGKVVPVRIQCTDMQFIPDTTFHILTYARNATKKNKKKRKDGKYSENSHRLVRIGL